jgi:hypothetical protein
VSYTIKCMLIYHFSILNQKKNINKILGVAGAVGVVNGQCSGAAM